MILYHQKHCKIEKAVNFMVTVYSSALIFDPWNEIAECKDSPALLYLSHAWDAGRGELIKPQHKLGRVVTQAQSPHTARHLGVHSLQSAPKENFVPFGQGLHRTLHKPLLPRRQFLASPVPICQRDKELLCRMDCTGKKKRGRIISAGVFLMRFFIFLNPTGSLIIIYLLAEGKKTNK